MHLIFTERANRGDMEMKSKALLVAVTSLLISASSAVIACEYKAGETKFLDYALCRYDEDSIQVVNLPEEATWEACIYYLEAFRPPKLLAVTKMQNGKEMISISDRSKIGNPCYLAKQHCDAALKLAQQ